MKRMTKLLSLMLAALMLVGMLPLGVWAAGETHTVRFNLNYNGAPKLSDQQVADGDYATQPEGVVRDGWHFSYWYVKRGNNQIEKFDLATTPITTDVTLYARWTEDTLARAEKMAQGLELAKRMEEKEEPEEPTVSFTLYVDQSILTIEQTPKIYFYAETDDTVESITLLHGKEQIATLYDDGQFAAHGDDIAGDGIYSACVETSAYDEGVEKFTATYENKKSNTVEVTFYHIISDEVLLILDTANTYICNLVDSENFKEMPIADRKIAADKLVDTLIEKKLIVEESLYYDEIQYSYGFNFVGDILGGIDLVIGGTELNGGDSLITYNDISLYDTTFLNDITTNSTNSTGDNSDIGTALILNSFPAFETEQEDIDYRTNFYVSTRNEWNSKGLKTTLDTNVTVSDYKTIDDYNVVVFATHGNLYKNNIFSTEYPAICLAEFSTSQKNKDYSTELSNKEIAVKNGRFYILPAFFINSFNQNALSNTFVFSECCMALGKNLTYNYHMSSAIIGRGAKGYIGFHNSVFASYSRELMKEYVDHLIAGDTHQEAYIAAIVKMGSNHEVWFNNTNLYTLKEYTEKFKKNPEKYNPAIHIAYPQRFGNDSAVLINTGIKNGDFELSLLPNIIKTPLYWTCVGDARVMKQLGEVLPYGPTFSAFGNKQMGMITTGVGSKSTSAIGAGTEGSYIAQRFLVPEGAKTLTFSYNFISEEPMEFVGSQFDDAFGIQIVQGKTAVVNKIFESINTSTWYPVSGINFDGGDDTVFQTKWKDATVDISKYAGKVITLYFVIYDVGDSIYDSACLLDNIAIN